MSEPKYPHINVKLVGEDGNAFFIIGRCTAAMRRAGLSQDEMKEFINEAQSGNYDQLLQTVMKWFATDEPEDEDDDCDSLFEDEEEDDEDDYDADEVNGDPPDEDFKE